MRGLNYAFPILLAMTASAGANPDTIERAPVPRPDPTMRGRTNRDASALVTYGRWPRRRTPKTPTTRADFKAIRKAKEKRIRREAARLKAAGLPPDVRTLWAGTNPPQPIKRWRVSTGEALPFTEEQHLAINDHAAAIRIFNEAFGYILEEEPEHSVEACQANGCWCEYPDDTDQ